MSAEPAGDARLFDLEPDLISLPAGPNRELVRRSVIVSVLSLARGIWDPENDPAVDPSHFGLLVLDGILTRECQAAGRSSLELLCCGDVLCPDVAHADLLSSVPQQGVWRVLEKARLAVLDHEFLSGVAGLDGVVARLSRRIESRSRDLVLRLAMNDVPLLERRLESLLWHLADRRGKRRGGAVVIDLPLTHELIGELAGADKRAVSRALVRLGDRGLISRDADGTFLLMGEPPGTETEAA